MKRKCLLVLLMGMLSLTACGKDAKTPVSSLDVNGASGNTVNIAVSDESFNLKEVDDGFVISGTSGSVHGEFISEIEANNLMAKYYDDADYHTVSLQDNNGFSYVDDGETVSGDSVSNNKSGMYAHVIELESGDYVRLVCSSEYALLSVEDALLITAHK